MVANGQRVVARNQNFVARGLDPRAYPFGRLDGVGAPQRVDPRVKPGDDEREPGVGERTP